MEPEDSLIMGDENLSTIPEKEPDEFIKPSVEDLIPIPSESEDTDDESLPEEDIQDENFKTYLNPLFEFDEEYIFSDINPLFNEVLEDIDSKESYVSNFDDSALQVTHLFDANEDECFDPGGDIDKIDTFLDIDVSTNIEDSYHDSEGDVIYLECLLTNDTTHNLHPEVFLDHDPRSLKDEPDNDDLKSMVKVFDPRIHEKIISPTYVRLPFEDHYYFSLTFVIIIFLPYLTYSMDSSLLLSSGSEDTIFDPGIFVFSARGKPTELNQEQRSCKFKIIRKEFVEIESFKSSTQNSTINEFIIINIPEEDVEPEPNLPLQEVIILDTDDQPMWESAKTVAPTPNSVIIQLDIDDNFVINSTHVNMIRENKFDGYLQADPHDHIREFLAIYNMFSYGKTQSEVVKLMIFPLSLCDKTKTWFNELNEESITSWEQMRKAFINRFFPPSLFNHLLLEIKNSLNIIKCSWEILVKSSYFALGIGMNLVTLLNIILVESMLNVMCFVTLIME
ncbi:retrovirus-related pol polyprotein from transposon TNT 1-94 [Tanacetum coccineum]|uniref:Retrovirus-related pol polyprotein from transposon TNT 1-94 n=1 Tax=Tanacetum coccineum TaxID=301880 RepID=A0ABQ5APK2_9ASTR